MNSKRFAFLFLKYVQSLYTTLILPPLNGMDNVLVLRMEFRGLVVKTLDLKIMVSSVVGSNPLRCISKIFFHKSSESLPNRLKKTHFSRQKHLRSQYQSRTLMYSGGNSNACRI